jgi:hypothetical protein
LELPTRVKEFLLKLVPIVQKYIWFLPRFKTLSGITFFHKGNKISTKTKFLEYVEMLFPVIPENRG